MIQNYCRTFFLVLYALFLPALSDGCTFTSANSTTFIVGQEGVFNVTVKPQGKITMTPSIFSSTSSDWLHLDKNVDGSYTLHGIPPIEASSSYRLSFQSIPTEDIQSCLEICLPSCKGTTELEELSCRSYCSMNCNKKNICNQDFTLYVKGAQGTIPNSPQNLTVNQVSSTDPQIRAKAHPKDISFQNVISWKAPKGKSNIISYRIYTGDRFENLLLTIVPSSDKKRFRVIDPNANPCHIQRYHVVSVDAFGNISEPASAKIKGTKHNCLIFKQEEREESNSSSNDR